MYRGVCMYTANVSKGRAMRALLGALCYCFTPGLREGRAFVPPSLFRSIPLQVSHVSHTRLCKLESLVLVGDKDPRSVRLDIEPCQNDWTSPFTMPPQPMSRFPARWPWYVLWVGLRRRDGGCRVGRYTPQHEGSDAEEETLEDGGAKRPVGCLNRICRPRI
jgi:hypothetical protein